MSQDDDIYRPLPDRTVVDEQRGQVRCDRCKESIPLPRGVSIWVLQVLRGFRAAHRFCQEGGGRRCYFQSPPPMVPDQRPAAQQQGKVA